MIDDWYNYIYNYDLIDDYNYIYNYDLIDDYNYIYIIMIWSMIDDWL
jgi:hypothetical protein